MISREEYVMQSLELHLFWGRIMKEHLLFLEAEKKTKYYTGLEINCKIT